MIVMEDNGLNISRPLLSVRRFSSIASPQKNENRRNENTLPNIGSSSKSELRFDPIMNSKFDPIMNSGSIPFGWENSPGNPKDQKNKQILKENPPSIPKLPPGRFLNPRNKDLDTNNKKITRFRSPKSIILGSSSSNDHDHDLDDDDDDDDDSEAFMDALDTLSRGETSFYNCSASGVSVHESDTKQTLIPQTDRKTRDFMMGRFLPAAKAMASDANRHNFKKNIIKEAKSPLAVKKSPNINNNNNKVELRYGPNFLQDVTHEKEKQEKYEDDSDLDYDFHENGNHSSKFCGLIPRFCSVNPVHGMLRTNKLQISSPINSISEPEKEPARIATYEHRSLNNVSNLEGSKLYNRLQEPFQLQQLQLQSPVSKQNDLNLKKKGLSFRELLAENNCTNESEEQELTIEKTLYVDTIQTVKSPLMRPESSFDESLESVNNFDDDESDHGMKTKKQMSLWKDPDLYFYDDQVVDFKKGQQDLKGFDINDFEIPKPPPLPQSPSDSWLWKTLPSVSSKNAPVKWNPDYQSSNTFDSEQNTDKIIGSPQGPLHSIPED